MDLLNHDLAITIGKGSKDAEQDLRKLGIRNCRSRALVREAKVHAGL
jgi:hypothetical protein